MRYGSWIAAVLLSLVFVCPASAAGSFIDSASIEYGQGKDMSKVRLGLQSEWKNPLWRFQNTQIGGYWDFSLANWHLERYRNANVSKNITVIGVTPVFRLESHNRRGWYGELGIGAHYLSDLYENNGDKLSTHFQFGDHVGVGYRWDKVDLTLKYQHYSNGGIKKPNSGADFVVLRLLYAF